MRDTLDKQVLVRAAWRIVPFLGLIYFVSFLDRVNVGFAALTMNREIGLSATTYGVGAGIFFIGYILFAVPSSMMMQRLGPSRWLGTITATWGVLSFGMAVIHTPTQFVVLRFLIGAAESGFFPGVVLYLTHWFPADVRGRIIGNFFIAVPWSNVFGAPLSGALLQHTAFGFSGWRTMFMLEAAPAIVLGLFTFAWIEDAPREAAWLTHDEQCRLERLIDRDVEAPRRGAIAEGLTHPAAWALGTLYFLIVLGLYGFGFWAPQIFKAMGNLTSRGTGWVTAIPYIGAVLAMGPWARHSDIKGERPWHVALPMLLSALGFAWAGHAESLQTALLAFTLAVTGIYAACPVFWTMPVAVLSAAAAPSGIAPVNSLGNIAGYFGPVLMGWLKEHTGSYTPGIEVLAISMLAAVCLAIAVGKRCHLATAV